MPSRPKLPAAVAVVAFLALVAGTAAVPAQALPADRDRDLAARRVATKLKSTTWPATPATYGADVYVNGKITSKKRAKRVVLLQMRLPSGWKQVSRDKTNGKGRFHLALATSWYHKRLPFRVLVKPTRKADGKAGKAHGLTVKPTYSPAGRTGDWSRIAPGYQVQFNACAPVRWRLNTRDAPDGVRPEVTQAMRQLGAATGIRFVYAGKTRAIPGSSRPWPRNTNLVVAWASPEQTQWPLGGNTIGRGGQLQTRQARNAKGQRVHQITRSGLVLDNTFDAPPGFEGPNARGSILVHELGHVVGLGHAEEESQQLYFSAVNAYDGVYQAGDLSGMRKVGLMTGCLRKVRRFGKVVPGYVPAPEAVTTQRPGPSRPGHLRAR